MCKPCIQKRELLLFVFTGHCVYSCHNSRFSLSLLNLAQFANDLFKCCVHY